MYRQESQHFVVANMHIKIKPICKTSVFRYFIMPLDESVVSAAYMMYHILHDKSASHKTHYRVILGGEFFAVADVH